MKWLFLVFHMKLTCLAPHSHVVLLPNQRLVTQSISLPPWWSRCWDSKELLFSCSVVSDSLQPPWTAARQASLSFTISQSFLKLMPIESVMPSNHLILSHPLLFLLSIFPSLKVFFSESAHRIRWPKYWSINSFNDFEDWFPLGLTTLIFLTSKWLSRVFSSTTIWKHQFFYTQPFLWSNSHICTQLLKKSQLWLHRGKFS